jgi:hypothetical protein
MHIMAVQRSLPSSQDAVTWWRSAYERDLDAFIISHGRRPSSLLELSRWLKPMATRGMNQLEDREPTGPGD